MHKKLVFKFRLAYYSWNNNSNILVFFTSNIKNVFLVKTHVNKSLEILRQRQWKFIDLSYSKRITSVREMKVCCFSRDVYFICIIRLLYHFIKGTSLLFVTISASEDLLQCFGRCFKRDLPVHLFNWFSFVCLFNRIR